MNDKTKKLMELIQKDAEFLKLPAKIIETYMVEDGTSMQSAVRDCITDLLHYAYEKGIDAQKVSEGAIQVFKEEKWQKEQDLGCMIRIEVMDDGDTYISKVTKDVQDIGSYIHHPMTDEGISDLKVELADYGHDEDRILEAIENLYYAPLNDSVEV